MKDIVNNDNLYPEGTILCAKAFPEWKLIITKYKQRIYYCTAVDHPEQNNFAYFENELIPPNPASQMQLTRIVSKAREKNYQIRDGFTI